MQKFLANKTSKNTSLNRLFPYEDVINDLDYMFVHGYEFYNKSFARKLTFINSDYSNVTFYSFNTVNFNKPLKIRNSDSSLLLNLTPCKENSSFYLIETGLSRQFPIHSISEEFDSTAYSYFKLFIDILQKSSNSGQYLGFEVCWSFLHDKYDYNSIDSLNYFIREINENQNLSLSIIDPELDGDHYLEYGSNDYYVGELIREIEKIEDLDIVDYLFTKFVLSTSGGSKTKINETEEKNLAAFLAPYLRENSQIPNNFTTISLLNRYLKDSYKINFSTSMINCEFTPLILRAWDIKKNRVLYDTVGNEISGEISMCFDTRLNFNMNKTNNHKYAFQNSQLNPSEIYKTGVIVSVKEMSGDIYLNERVDHTLKWDIMEFFKSDSINYNVYYNYIKKNMVGINISEVDVSIPFKNKQILTKANDFWLNNNLITFKLKMKNKQANKMRSNLLALGFNDIRIIQTEGYSELVIIKLKN